MSLPPSMPHRVGLPLLVLLATLMTLPVAAERTGIDPYFDWRDELERGGFEYDDSQDPLWIESETDVLALPRPDDLVQVRLDSLPPGIEMFIDRSRITVGDKDRVIRAWLWTRGSGGAENGTFEGYRCETREFKVYAYANPRRDPPVNLARRSSWQKMEGPKSRNYRLELLEDYFCGIRGTRSAREIAEYLSGEFRRERFMSE